MKWFCVAVYEQGVRRTPHGVRGLKFADKLCLFVRLGRTPHGVRGLKYHAKDGQQREHCVAPRTGCVD